MSIINEDVASCKSCGGTMVYEPGAVPNGHPQVVTCPDCQATHAITCTTTVELKGAGK